MYTIFTDDSINTKVLPKRSSLVNFSLYKELYCPILFRSFSIKYVSEGCEKYTVNGNKYHVRTGDYLLANHHSEGYVEIESTKAVKGICIDVAPDLLSEVVASYRRPDTPFSDLDLDPFFNSSQFYENKYQSGQTHIGKFLHSLDVELSKNPFEKKEFSKEFYFSLAENILLDHIPIYKQLQSVPSLRSVTRKDLLRRITKGKEFIDAHYTKSISVLTVANESNISEYHFYRLFKTFYGISPKQYIVEKRLKYAISKLKKGNSTVTQIAIESGFSDIHSFSKSFKNHFGVSPSTFQV